MSAKNTSKEKQDNEDNRVWYAVMKLLTDIEVENPFTRIRENIKLGGLAGYIAVYDTIEEAKESAQNGKYEIIAIKSISA